MGGKASRDKGARGERSLVMHLTLLGYDARRVIRTRAVGGYENDVVPDVIATKDGRQYTFENKVRKAAFKTIYELFAKESVDGVYRFSIRRGLVDGPLVAIGTDFEEVARVDNTYFPTVEENRTYAKMLGLRKLLKGADFLCIKDNNKPFLFVRFWR